MVQVHSFYSFERKEKANDHVLYFLVMTVSLVCVSKRLGFRRIRIQRSQEHSRPQETTMMKERKVT